LANNKPGSKKYGVSISVPRLKNKDGKHTGEIFVNTVALSKSRKDIAAYIEENGGKVSGSVSKNTSYLLCNKPSNSSKYKKAEKL